MTMIMRYEYPPVLEYYNVAYTFSIYEGNGGICVKSEGKKGAKKESKGWKKQQIKQIIIRGGGRD